MEESIIYRSPVICYEVSKNGDSYSINVYLEGFRNSDSKNLSCEIKDFSTDESAARHFALILSQSAALPIHIPELAEEFLSI